MTGFFFSWGNRLYGTQRGEKSPPPYTTNVSDRRMLVSLFVVAPITIVYVIGFGILSGILSGSAFL